MPVTDAETNVVGSAATSSLDQVLPLCVPSSAPAPAGIPLLAAPGMVTGVALE